MRGPHHHRLRGARSARRVRARRLRRLQARKWYQALREAFSGMVAHGYEERSSVASLGLFEVRPA